MQWLYHFYIIQLPSFNGPFEAKESDMLSEDIPPVYRSNKNQRFQGNSISSGAATVILILKIKKWHKQEMKGSLGI
jgi:hypothetical protein